MSESATPRLRASVVCFDHAYRRILAVRLEDPLTHAVRAFLPGGAVEANETPMAAAMREAMEEAGVEVILEPASELVRRYDFVWGGKTFDCTTHFYRGVLALNASDLLSDVVDAPYHRGCVWIPREAIEEAFGFHDEIYATIAALVRDIA